MIDSFELASAGTEVEHDRILGKSERMRTKTTRGLVQCKTSH